MAGIALIAYLFAAIVPALARSWRSWFILSGLSLLPAGLTFWIIASSDGFQVLWLVFLMWCLLGISIIGILAGAFGVFGQQKRWKLASRPLPVLLAGSIAILSLAYGAVAATSVVP